MLVSSMAPYLVSCLADGIYFSHYRSILNTFLRLFEKAKTACEFIDRIYKVFAFDPIDNARYMRPLLYNPGIPVPSSDPDAPQFV
ncbi:unnamed protein product [Heterobilharzia americana]|nr:unnamed protein product [Heterobilharzia americana]